ncbi:ARM repeat-containing protein [Rozella allomycis CSF55]|uniref:ARM repeat-containing protein n=1 Tax=Rozella allomycis (strain CSF55) TaxID=988480 RepID=A0A4P9YFJ2_ROZAC|nr:ARM repeat-containing protein [Rozella allomycis CSF55]
MDSNQGNNNLCSIIDVESQIKAIQKARQEGRLRSDQLAFGSTTGDYEKDLYAPGAPEYSREIVEEESDKRRLVGEYGMSREIEQEVLAAMPDNDMFLKEKASVDKSEYHKRRLNRVLSPERRDPFNKNDKGRGFKDAMMEQEVDKEEIEIYKMIEEKKKESLEVESVRVEVEEPVVKKRRWDQTPTPKSSEWDKEEASVSKSRWDQTPVSMDSGATPSRRNRWDETPVVSSGNATSDRKSKSRWDETPVYQGGMATPLGNAQPMMTPMAGDVSVFDARNRPMSDEELDAILPSKGYAILEAPSSYVPIRTPARKLMATPSPMDVSGFMMGTPQMNVVGDMGQGQPSDPSLPFVKAEDYQHFSKLLEGGKEEELSVEEIKERKIMRLLLKIKNGLPAQRKSALRQLTMNAREFGAGPLFNQILPLLMSPTLDDQERHMLVKVIDRVLYKLDDLVRPYVHKILVVIEPLLIDEDYYARVEGREIISNLSKAAGLATMIASMRPDIDHQDEYVRNTTARAFSVVGSALGIPSLLPFLKAVCKSKKSWQARHTGIKIVQQIAILMGCAVLPHLTSLVETIAEGLKDEQQKVKTITGLALAALAEASSPYGIESFSIVLEPLWKGIRQQRGKVLASFLKAIGCIIPLMDSEYANYYVKEVMEVLRREFQTPDEEMKKIVLKVIKQCVSTEGVTSGFIKSEILPDYFKYFWVRRMALDKRNYKAVVETTVELAKQVGGLEIVKRIVEDLKDESEVFRRMVMDSMNQIIKNIGSLDFDDRLIQLMIDGCLFAFQEQTEDSFVVMNCFGTVVQSLGIRSKPFLNTICSTILWRLNNKSAKVRQQAADLVKQISPVMNICNEEKLLTHLSLVLYESLGEEYPEVLGSILGSLKSIVNVIGMNEMKPPIKDLLPRLTPILRNRHEKVQENCIDLVGRIADRASDQVSAREWMRICFELLEMVKSQKKSIRRSAVNTFGFISKAIGPQDVLATLLNNLKVQERNMRICTTIAIAIVAENCGPFTVLPALMNEYRVPEANVQNGVLKALSFLFEYIGEIARDYIYSVTPMLEDALMDRDLVHRQIASSTIKHLSLGVYGAGCEDVLTHLLNFIWPNVLETSAHMMQAVIDAVDGLRVSIGPGPIFFYLVQGLFHPARRVREIYWKIYNNLYIGHQDALVAYYTRVEDDDENLYARCELDLLI